VYVLNTTTLPTHAYGDEQYGRSAVARGYLLKTYRRFENRLFPISRRFAGVRCVTKEPEPKTTLPHILLVVRRNYDEQLFGSSVSNDLRKRFLTVRENRDFNIPSL